MRDGDRGAMNRIKLFLGWVLLTCKHLVKRSPFGLFHFPCAVYSRNKAGAEELLKLGFRKGSQFSIIL
jgi:hypothetical protein